MQRATVLLLSIVIGFGAIAGQAAAAPGSDGAPPAASFTTTSSFCADDEELEFLRRINDYRAAHGRGRLVLTQTLSAASEHHSLSMAKHNYFDHDLKPEGISWSKNMTNHGYDYNTWRGENIAAGRGTAEGAFDQWRNSPAHNDNMLLGHFNAIGIGRVYVADSRYGWYWTTDFGGRRDAAPSC